jgi:carbonic anhydrase
MSVTDELIESNRTYAASFAKGDLPLPPARKVAVVACMDARLDPARILGLEEGDAHVIRNAGGVVTEDVIRSLTISQTLLGTEEIALIHHTDCGMLTFTDDELRARPSARPALSPHGHPRPSPSSTPTCASRSPASKQARSSRIATACAASCTKSRTGDCGRSPEDATAAAHVARRGPRVSARLTNVRAGPPCKLT